MHTSSLSESTQSRGRRLWAAHIERAFCLFVLLVGASTAWAAEESVELRDIVVFGASFSDVGNDKLALPGVVMPPYFEGRFSDGPVWHEVMAERLGLPPASVPSLLGGNNYAFGGAEMGPGLAELIMVPNVGTQIDIHLARQAQLGQLPLPADTLFIVSSGGGNNLIPPGLSQEPEVIVGYIEDHVTTLAEAGARHFLVTNFFDIEKAPFMEPLFVSPSWLPPGIQTQEVADDILARADEVNRRLRGALPRLERHLDRKFGGVTISLVDMFTTTKVISKAPQLFGIENTTETALTPPFPACFCTGFLEPGVDPDRYLWFDEIHPTARVHEILGELAAGSLHPALKTGPSGPPGR